MPKTLSTAELGAYRDRIVAGGLSEAVKVYGELDAQGYKYAGWAKGVATGNTVTGVSALDFLTGTALVGIGSQACKDLTQAQIDSIRLEMAKGYLNTLITTAKEKGDAISSDVDFNQTEKFHADAFKQNGLSIDNWTLEIPMSLIRKTQGDTAVDDIWQNLRDTGGSGASSILASTLLSTRIGMLAFSSDPAVAAAAAAWMAQTPGFANFAQIGRSISVLYEAYFGKSATPSLTADQTNAVLNSVTSLSVQQTSNGGISAQATIKNPNTGIASVYTITTSVIANVAMTGSTLVTTINTQSGQVTYALIDTKGNPRTGNVAANGNVSFYVDGQIQVFNNGAYIGSFATGGGAGTLANGTSGNYSYDLTSGVITHTTSSIGGVNVAGFTLTETTTNGTLWSNRDYRFSSVAAATAADYAAWDGLANGRVDTKTFEGTSNASSEYLVNVGTLSTPTTYSAPNLSPIGAFYESRSAGNDPALSIASKTFRIFNSANQALSAAQLSALDANKDGQLSGAELAGLNAWSDLNEDGILNAGEMTPLRMALINAGLSSLRSTDYAFYTAGNANARSVAENTATAPVNSLTAPAVPASNYTTLRYNDNHRTVSMGTIVDQYISVNGGTPIPWKTHYGETQWYDWNTGQIKQTNDNTSLVGTEGNDNFDANYYSSVSWLPSGGLVNFYGGGGNDVMGGSGRNDNLWGGTGNDTLFGYDGDDHLYGEDGSDELQGGNGNDVLDGGTGDDRLFGQVGNDTLNGGDGNDLMMGFTGTNEAKQTLNAGETDNDTMFGGNGNDQMYGGLGDDYMDGGNDNDLVVGGDGNDTLFGGAGDDEVNGGNGNDVLDGGAGADKLFGGVGNDRMWGGDGNDIMMGFNPTNDSKQTLAAGETDDDVMYGGAGDDLMLGGLGNDQLWGGIGNDEVQGGEGNDQIYGEDGNDRLFGGAGNDIIYGGNGDDLIVGGAATNETALAAGTADNNFLYGGAGNDTILGGIGNDYIDGGAGADNMQGGQGDDIYIVNSVNDVILEQQNEGYDTVISSSNYILNANIEELRLTEGGSYNGTGNSLNNKIIGNSQDNILDGVTGADTMIGGLGNDTYYVDNVGDQVIELAGEGIDTVQSSISYTLGDNVENLNLLDFSKAEKGIADGVDILVYGYPKANELDYMQGNAIAGYKGTCALTSIANLATQANQALSEAQVVQKAIDNQWCVTDPAKTDYQRGGSNYVGQQALLDSYGIRNGIIMGFNEQAVANLLKGGRGVIIGVNAGKLWGDNNYLDDGGINHVVTVTGVACNAQTGEITGFYIADSGRGLVSDMTRYVSLADFRNDANVTNAYAIYTIDPIKFWEENIDATGNALDNTLIGNRGNNVITGGQGNDTLIGQAGDDTYVFNAGDGHDTISDSDGHDVILFGAGIRASDIQITRSGSVMTLSLNANDSIALATANGLEIEEVQFADGVTWYAKDDGSGYNARMSGSVSVQGNVVQGQVITLQNDLSDADGMGALTYQWQSSVDGVTWSDISGATNDSLVLSQAQVGSKLRAQVAYVDGRGNTESAVSSITDTVANVNDIPTGSVEINGIATQNQVLTATNTLADQDGLGTLNYQWQSSVDGMIWTDIAGAVNSTLTLAQDQVGKQVRAVINYQDGQGTQESVVSAGTSSVANVNDAPTGTVTISGTATQNQVLTATNTLADVDGMGPVAYQWLADGVAISAATSDTLTLTQAQVGKAISVIATYTDGQNAVESVTSVATAVVGNVNDAPTGIVTINGSATQNQVLTATNTLSDLDGLGALNYRWQSSVDGLGWTDIANATNSAFTLTQDQVGKQVRVAIGYQDGQGTQESIFSDTTAVIANVNDAPTGTVTISGTATQNQILTAANTLADVDGMGTVAYQWLADGVAISGATANTLKLAQAQVGKAISVNATYTDGQGTQESVNSLATSAVISANHAPTGTVTIKGTTTQNQVLTAANTLADVDGMGTVAYQWLADGVAISGATANTLKLAQAQVGKAISVKATYTDGQKTVESVTSAATAKVVNVNDAPTGAVTISGTATQNQILTATNTLADVDGMGTVAYQWLADGIAISGATANTLKLTQAQVGKAISVKATYTDGQKTVESVTSAATAKVVNVNDAPTGTVTISGTATQNQILTAANTLADVDGMGTVAYQWLADGVAISGATANTLKLAQAQVGKAISVKATYTDGQKTVESVTSAATAKVVNVNDAPTGTVTISGTATQNQILTAANTLADVDGMGTVAYQWLADGVAISGATANTLKLAQAQVGKAITVKATYTDGQKTVESVASAATAKVANVNDAPTGTVTISGTATQNQILTAANTLADVDGMGTVAYQWLADGVAISGATANTLKLAQAQVGKAISVKATYTDGQKTVESVTSAVTAKVVNVNDAPTGTVTISGTATQNQILTAANTLADVDGMGTVAYQWQVSADSGKSWTNIANATSATFTLTSAQVGKQVRAVGSYTDGQKTLESVASAVSAIIGKVATGTTGNDSLTGTAGMDVFASGAGNDTLNGGLGNDTYSFNRGDGQDRIVDTDATAGNKDLLSFGSNIANDQLWFRHQGNDLIIDVIGTSDKVTIQDWYKGTQNQVEQIRVSNGSSLVNTDVEKLVQAMASLTPPSSGTLTLTSQQRTALAPTLAASWH